MSAPRRIQRKREKGWTMPEGAVYVGRPTKWGNPLTSRAALESCIEAGFADNTAEARIVGAQAYRDWILHNDPWAFGIPSDQREQRQRILAEVEELRGRDLCCWCPLGRPCHADVLLELANG